MQKLYNLHTFTKSSFYFYFRQMQKIYRPPCREGQQKEEFKKKKNTES